MAQSHPEMIRLPRPLQLKLPLNLNDGSLAKNRGHEEAKRENSGSRDVILKPPGRRLPTTALFSHRRGCLVER